MAPATTLDTIAGASDRLVLGSLADGVGDSVGYFDNISLRGNLGVANPQTGEPFSYTWLYVLAGFTVILGAGITFKKKTFNKR